MDLRTGQLLELLDAKQRALGQITLEERQGDLLLGRFAPGPDFPAVEPLFREFEEAVNAQALGAADRCEAAIGALGLRLRAPGNREQMEIKDVQIWSDGGISCRIGGAVTGALNGNAQAATPVERMRKT
jgi:hypothetical protein